MSSSSSSRSSSSSSSSESDNIDEVKITKGGLIDILQSFKNKILDDYVNNNNFPSVESNKEKNRFGPFLRNEFNSIISEKEENSKIALEKKKKKEEEMFKKNFVVLLNYYYKTDQEMYRKLSDEYNHRMHNYIMNRIKLPAIFGEKIRYASDVISKRYAPQNSANLDSKSSSYKMPAKSFAIKAPSHLFSFSKSKSNISSSIKSSNSDSLEEYQEDFDLSEQEIHWISERNFVSENLLNCFILYLNEKMKAEQSKGSFFVKHRTKILQTYFYKEMSIKLKKFGGMVDRFGNSIIPEKYKINEKIEQILIVISLGASEYVILFFDFINFRVLVVDPSSNKSTEFNYYKGYFDNCILFLDLKEKIKKYEKKRSKMQRVIVETTKTKGFNESAIYICYFIYALIKNEENFQPSDIEIEVFKRKFIQFCEQLLIRKSNWGTIQNFAFFPL